jgi:hypothetical protein
MCNDHHGSTGPHQIGQKFIIEFAPEFRILLCRPLVEQKDRALLEQADDERETPALAAGKIQGPELPVGQARLIRQPELPEQAIELAGLRLGNPL